MTSTTKKDLERYEIQHYAKEHYRTVLQCFNISKNSYRNSTRDFSVHNLYRTKQQQRRWFVAATTNLRYLYELQESDDFPDIRCGS